MRVKDLISNWKKRPNGQKAIIMIIAAFVIFFLVNGLTSIISKKMVDTITLSDQPIEKKVECYGFLNVPSTPVKIGTDGDVHLLKKDGERVAKNRAILRITTDNDKKKKAVVAPESGIVSYQIHGYETLDTLPEFMELDMKKLYESSKATALHNQQNVHKNDVVAKIIDNLQPTILYVKVPATANEFANETGDIVSVRFPDYAVETNGKVMEIVDAGEGYQALSLELEPLPDEILTDFATKTELYTILPSELSLSPDVIVYNEGEPGVYIVQNRQISWQKVTIKRETEDRIYCENLPTDTTIVTTPKRVRVGDLI